MLPKNLLSNTEATGDRWGWVRRLLSKAGALLILAGTAAGSAFLLAPGMPSEGENLTDANLGQSATTTIRASRDSVVPDEEATRRRREEAVAQVRPVYDLDGQALAEVQSRIRDSFAFMRQALPKTAEPPRGGSPESARTRQKLEIAQLLELEPARQELMARLQTAVDPKDFASLVQEGFTSAAEQAVRELVGSEMSRMLVADRELLSGA